MDRDRLKTIRNAVEDGCLLAPAMAVELLDYIEEIEERSPVVYVSKLSPGKPGEMVRRHVEKGDEK